MTDKYQGATINLILRLRGGGYSSKEQLTKEMAIAPGGFIQQTIVKDTLSPDEWDTEKAVTFNIKLLDAALLGNIGLPVPPTPITAATYSEHGYPFFKMYEDPSGIAGTFAVNSVGELDEEAGINEDIHEAENALGFREIVIAGRRWGDAKSAPVSLDTRGPISTFLPIRLREKAEK